MSNVEVSRKELHKTVRNYLFNDLGLNKGEAQKLLLDTIAETMGEETMQPGALRELILDEVRRCIDEGFPKERWFGRTSFRGLVKEAIKEVVYDQLKHMRLKLDATLDNEDIK